MRTFEIVTITHIPRDQQECNNNRRESLARTNATLLFQQRCMRILFSPSLSLSLTLAHIVVDSCTWHASVILVVSARDTSVVGAHIAPWTPRFTPVRPSARSLARSSGSTAEHKCPQEERYRGIWLGPPGRQNRPSGAGPYPILHGSLTIRIGFSRGHLREYCCSKLPGYNGLSSSRAATARNYCQQMYSLRLLK